MSYLNFWRKKLDWNRNVPEKFESLQSWIHFFYRPSFHKRIYTIHIPIIGSCYCLVCPMPHLCYTLYYVFPFVEIASYSSDSWMDDLSDFRERPSERERTKTKRGAGPSLERTSLVFVLTLTLTVRVLRRLLVRPLL